MMPGRLVKNADGHDAFLPDRLTDGRPAVKVNTLAFVVKEDKDTDYLEILKKIADDTGGKFRSINAGELGK